MIMLVLGLIMTHRDSGVQQCSTVLMEAGTSLLFEKLWSCITKLCLCHKLKSSEQNIGSYHYQVNICYDFRLFSCGTSKEGDSFLVEWNESEGALKRTYLGFRKKSAGVVQFDTTRNRFLAVGEDNQIKFWNMDNTNLLTVVEAEGGLPV